MATHRVNSRRQQAGFTMIEVMIAMLLTALAVIGVLGLYRIESRASSFSRRETEAAVLAQDKLEELRTQAAPASGTSGSATRSVQPTSTRRSSRGAGRVDDGGYSGLRIAGHGDVDEDGYPAPSLCDGQRGAS